MSPPLFLSVVLPVAPSLCSSLSVLTIQVHTNSANCETISYLSVCHAYSDVSASLKAWLLKEGVGSGQAPRKQHGPSRTSHHPLAPGERGGHFW